MVYTNYAKKTSTYRKRTECVEPTPTTPCTNPRLVNSEPLLSRCRENHNMTSTGTNLAETRIYGIRVVPLGNIHPTSSISVEKVASKTHNIKKDIKFIIHLFTLYLLLGTSCLVLRVSGREKCILCIMLGLPRSILHLISTNCLVSLRIKGSARVLD